MKNDILWFIFRLFFLFWFLRSSSGVSSTLPLYIVPVLPVLLDALIRLYYTCVCVRALYTVHAAVRIWCFHFVTNLFFFFQKYIFAHPRLHTYIETNGGTPKACGRTPLRKTKNCSWTKEHERESERTERDFACCYYFLSVSSSSSSSSPIFSSSGVAPIFLSIHLICFSLCTVCAFCVWFSVCF